MMKNAGLLIMCMALSFASCTSMDTSNSIKDDIASIKSQSRLFSQSYVSNDDAALMSIYAERAVIAPPRRPFITNRKDITAYWTGPSTRQITHHVATSEQIIIEGDLAYDWGQYEGVSIASGEPRNFGGKYLIVWSRGADGMWRMVQDMWN